MLIGRSGGGGRSEASPGAASPALVVRNFGDRRLRPAVLGERPTWPEDRADLLKATRPGLETRCAAPCRRYAGHATLPRRLPTARRRRAGRRPGKLGWPSAARRPGGRRHRDLRDRRSEAGRRLTPAQPTAEPLLEHPSRFTLHATLTLTGIDIDVTGVERRSGGLSADARLRAAEAAALRVVARVTLAGEAVYAARPASAAGMGSGDGGAAARPSRRRPSQAEAAAMTAFALWPWRGPA